MASLARPGVAYTLRGALYLALTNQTNATPLTRLRGPAFSMPASSKFQLLTEPEPTAAELVDAVDAFYDALPPIASRCASTRPRARLDSTRETSLALRSDPARTKGVTLDDARAAARATRASSSRDTANRCCATTRCATRCERC